ncbi:hypothetical protein DOTSEDRAFT_31748 [Dothistroma septosporum NZE10]|uniref:Uncharacterized protein n=1 Tax=Dothistroma septosporum (strain NZE10 / CBS 128990) TaxID=675120 RepID=N1PV87_DOTSN|nr:hypothetical protein DOTSEDRAFT_31748 [Dothistroma septosporum NZE10]
MTVEKPESFTVAMYTNADRLQSIRLGAKTGPEIVTSSERLDLHRECESEQNAYHSFTMYEKQIETSIYSTYSVLIPVRDENLSGKAGQKSSADLRDRFSAKSFSPSPNVRDFGLDGTHTSLGSPTTPSIEITAPLTVNLPVRRRVASSQPQGGGFDFDPLHGWTSGRQESFSTLRKGIRAGQGSQVASRSSRSSQPEREEDDASIGTLEAAGVCGYMTGNLSLWYNIVKLVFGRAQVTQLS